MDIKGGGTVESTGAGGFMATGSGTRVFQALAVARGLDSYAKHGMLMNRMWTPKNMIETAKSITGNNKLKGRDYAGAAKALREWAEAQKEPAAA